MWGGETDDHTWVYCPDRRVLCPGDLIIWGVPNAGNPQKVQRYPWDWAAALRAMAAKEPASLAPGHGGPVINDAELVGRILTETADYLDAVVERTLAVLEAGSPPHTDIVHAVELPETIYANHPYGRATSGYLESISTIQRDDLLDRCEQLRTVCDDDDRAPSRLADDVLGQSDGRLFVEIDTRDTGTVCFQGGGEAR